MSSRMLNQLETLSPHNPFGAKIAKVARGIFSMGQAEVALLCELDKRFRIFLQNQSFRDQTFRCLPDQLRVSHIALPDAASDLARVGRSLAALMSYFVLRRLNGGLA
jgi:hypothetical protein